MMNSETGSWEVRVSVSAWKDFDQPPRPRERKWRIEDILAFRISDDPQQLDTGTLIDALYRAHSTVVSWSERDLNPPVPLPQRDPNLKGAFAKGRHVP